MSEDLRPRTHQYRRCQPLHTVYGLVALLAGCGVLLEQPVMCLFVAPIGILVDAVRHLALDRARSAISRREQCQAAGGRRARAHRWWGAAAACLDAVLVAEAIAICTVLLLGNSDALVLRGRTADYLALGAGIVLTGAHAFTHRMSARAPNARRTEA
ncbi:hypothetical protein [Streptomyces sp. NPDC050485]|uniref:hypothetical protein n=1 Tax=Streptomyces sp. NPDC050485 TaxID=3365617 RepID=UPI00378CE40B